MSVSIRVSEETYRALKEMADGRSIQEIVSEAVEKLRIERFWAASAAAFAALRADPVAWAEEEADRAAWDHTLMDDLDGEPTVPAVTGADAVPDLSSAPARAQLPKRKAN